MHNVVTMLLKVQGDICHASNSNKGVLLVLLDLSAVFDMVDYNILLKCVKRRLDINGLALTWLRSYLTGIVPNVSISTTTSF